MQTEYDVIIIGGGPAGMTAGIYATRAGAKVLMIEKNGVGGQVALTSTIANYPGCKDIDGFMLSQNMFEQATALGVETLFAEVDNCILDEKIKKVVANGVTYKAPAIILSMGACSRGLGIENEKKFIGKGVSYCAVCDGAFFRNKTVAVVGGGNTALQDAIYLSPIAKKVYLVHRREGFRADSVVVEEFEKLCKTANIEKCLNKVVVDLQGDNKLEKMILRDVQDNTENDICVDGVFVAIGRNPNVELLNGEIALSNGYIKVNSQMETNIAGVYACGDIIDKSLRQIATAISDGAIAGTNASSYAKKNK